MTPARRRHYLSSAAWLTANGGIAPYTGCVSWGCRVFSDVTGGTSFVNAISVQGLYSTENNDFLSIMFQNFISSTPDTAPSGAMIIDNAAIEYPIGSTRQALLFSGSTTGTIASGLTLTSDVLNLTTQIPYGALYRIWYYYHYSGLTTGKIQYRTQGADPVTRGDQCRFGSSALPVANTVMSGAFPTTGNGTAGGATAYMPVLCVIGRATNPSILMVGDSICRGLGDEFSSIGYEGVLASSLPTNLATLNLGADSAKALHLQTDSTGRSAAWPYFSIVINELSVNDIVAGSATLVANQTSNAALFPNATQKYVCTSMASGVTSTTDGFSTIAGQGLAPTNAGHLSWNASVIAGSVPGYNGFFDIASITESSAGSGKFPVSPNARSFTDLVTVAGNPTVTSLTANFQASDKGYAMKILNAGAAGAAVMCYIHTVNGPTSVTVGVLGLPFNMTTANPSGTTAFLGGGSLDGTHFVPAVYATIPPAHVIPTTWTRP